MQFPIAVCYSWGRYVLTSYDEIVEKIKVEGKKAIEPIQKVIVSEAEYKVVATFYYINETVDTVN